MMLAQAPGLRGLLDGLLVLLGDRNEVVKQLTELRDATAAHTAAKDAAAAERKSLDAQVAKNEAAASSAAELHRQLEQAQIQHIEKLKEISDREQHLADAQRQLEADQKAHQERVTASSAASLRRQREHDRLVRESSQKLQAREDAITDRERAADEAKTRAEQVTAAYESKLAELQKIVGPKAA